MVCTRVALLGTSAHRAAIAASESQSDVLKDAGLGSCWVSPFCESNGPSQPLQEGRSGVRPPTLHQDEWPVENAGCRAVTFRLLAAALARGVGLSSAGRAGARSPRNVGPKRIDDGEIQGNRLQAALDAPHQSAEDGARLLEQDAGLASHCLGPARGAAPHGLGAAAQS